MFLLFSTGPGSFKVELDLPKEHMWLLLRWTWTSLRNTCGCEASRTSGSTASGAPASDKGEPGPALLSGDGAALAIPHPPPGEEILRSGASLPMTKGDRGADEAHTAYKASHAKALTQRRGGKEAIFQCQSHKELRSSTFKDHSRNHLKDK